MTAVGCQPAYERPDLRQVLGQALRPGGLALTRRALEFCALPPGARVLDLGSGPGGTISHLTRQGLRATGIDHSLTLLRDQVAGLNSPLVNGRAEMLPFASGAFQAVFSECVLSLVRDRDRALDEIFRVLEPGGHLIWTDVHRRGAEIVSSTSGGGPANCLQGAVSLGQTRKNLHLRGCVVELCETHDRLLTETAARLVFAGLDPAELFPCGNGCARRAGNKTFGYFLIIARKGGEG